MTVTEAVFRAFQDHPGSTAGEVAKRLRHDPRAVSALTSQLVAKERLRRLTHDPSGQPLPRRPARYEVVRLDPVEPTESAAVAEMRERIKRHRAERLAREEEAPGG